MKISSLDSKTVRPGYNKYSFYYSNRQQLKPPVINSSVVKFGGSQRLRIILFFILIISISGLAFPRLEALIKNTSNLHKALPYKTSGPLKSAPIVVNIPTPVKTVKNYCSQNSSQEIIVSITRRHLWACKNSQTVYDSPVVTGISYLAADLTPTGTYYVMSKQTNLTLTGTDSTGSWNDPVSYWMPFLDNKYGAYGFHDATWRPANSFGNISPSSANASHGCVELPLSTARWIYGWVSVGTKVTIEN